MGYWGKYRDQTIDRLGRRGERCGARDAWQHGRCAGEEGAPKAKSKCNAITEETACKADTTCIWIPATTNAKTGKQRKAYCKTKTGAKKKATSAKK